MNQQQLKELLKQSLNLVESIEEPKKVIENEVETCYICLEDIDLNKNSVSLTCGHKLHFDCFMKNMIINNKRRGKCGLCRKEYLSEDDRDDIREIQRQSRIETERRQEEYVRGLREEAERERTERRQADIDNFDRRQRVRNEETERYRRGYTALGNDERVPLLNSWRLRRHTCGYRILQLLQNATNHSIEHRYVSTIISRLSESYTHETYRRNLFKLQDKGYVTLIFNDSGYLSEIKLTSDYIRLI